MMKCKLHWENRQRVFRIKSFELRALREKLPKALVYTYFYDDNNLLLTDKTEPNGMQYHYSYDGLGKLRATYRIINGKHEVLNVYRYNYKTREK